MPYVELLYDPVQMNRVINKFEALGIAAGDTRPVMMNIAELMMVAIGKNFHAQGRRGGGSWKRLTDEWLNRKMGMGLDPRIGFATHKLIRSLTEPGAEGNILDVTNTYARIGSDLPYADAQQQNRPFAKLTLGDRLEMRALVRQHLVDAWLAAR